MPWIDDKLCTGCGECLQACILGAIIMGKKNAFIDNDCCHRCGACHDSCSLGAIFYGDRGRQTDLDGGSEVEKQNVLFSIRVRKIDLQDRFDSMACLMKAGIGIGR